jgi:hypothetical protein
MSLLQRLQARRSAASTTSGGERTSTATSGANAAPAVEVHEFSDGRKHARRKQREAAATRASLPCFECGETGHLVAQCPQRAANARAKEIEREEKGEFDTADCWRTVRAISATTLTGKRRREWEAEAIKQQGGWERKGQKVPFKILMGMRKKQKSREVKSRERQLESGVVGTATLTKNKRRGGRRVNPNAKPRRIR